MNVVHVCHTDIKWGASRAAYGIFSSLKEVNVDAKMLVQTKFSKDKNVISLSSNTFEKKKSQLRIISDLIPMYLFTKRYKGRFSFGNIGTDIRRNKIIREADIIHLHWINAGYLSIQSIYKLCKLNKPIFWTLHDMWAFTGGCHYAGDCIQFQDSCGYCPYLNISGSHDFSNKILKEKKELFKDINLNIVTPSKWLRKCAQQSSLFRDVPIEVIPYAIDLNLYKPGDKKEAKSELKFSEDQIYLLFGSMNIKDERKGYTYFRDSLINLLKESPSLKNKIKIIVFGKADEVAMKKDIPFEIIFLGRISNDKTLVSLYNASDFFVAPSLEDNYPNTVMESLACGLPVLAFNIGGMPDMIVHKQNGFLAESRRSESLTEGISWLIANKNKAELRESARKQIVDTNNPLKIANAYFELYKKYRNSYP